MRAYVHATWRLMKAYLSGIMKEFQERRLAWTEKERDFQHARPIYELHQICLMKAEKRIEFQQALHVWPRKCSFIATCVSNYRSRDNVIQELL